MKTYIYDKKNEMLQLLESLVNIDSGSYYKEGIDQIGTILAEKYEQIGFIAEVITQEEFGNHLILQHEASHDPKILIVAHMDTVFPKGTVAKRPFSMDKKRAYGPGIIDMKGSQVTLLYALRALLDCNDDSLKNVQIILNSDEEIGSLSSRKLIEKLSTGKKYALIMEPSRANGKLVSSRKGGGRFTLKIKGIGAHSGIEPERGVSAIQELAHKITKLHSLTDYDEGINVNVGLIKGGTSLNTIAPHAEAQIEMRVKTMEQAHDISEEIKVICTTSDVDGIELEFKGGITRPPMVKTEKSKSLASAIKDIGEDMGIIVDDVATGGGSDGAFTSAKGIPTIDGLGPIGGKAHSEKEYIDIDSIPERTLLLAKTIQELSH